MREYPKIETLWNRDEKTKAVIPGALRLPEFGAVRQWAATEKIDGTNIRIGIAENGQLAIGGRTDAAQVPTPLLSHLMALFTVERLREKFADSTFVIFGEGYGPKIQNGGGYSPTPQFRVFDVLVGEWWLRREDVADVAQFFGIRTVPSLGTFETLPHVVDDLAAIVGAQSPTGSEDGGAGCRPEGIVARSIPDLFTRRGDRVMWKLKYRDFRQAVVRAGPQEILEREA